MRGWKRSAAVLCAAVLMLGGCQRVTKEQKEYRDNGIARLEQGDYGGALEQFEQAVAGSSRVSDFETDVLKYRAEAEYQLGDFQAAAYTYDLLCQLDKQAPEYYYLGAACLARGNDAKAAAEKLEEGKKLDEKMEGPGYAEAMASLAEAYLASGDQEQADGIYQELIGAGKADTRVFSRLTAAYMKQEEYEKALEYAAQGLALSDNLAKKDLKFNQGVCYENLGNFSKALDCFNEYKEMFGSDEAVEHEIAFLVTR